MSEQPTLALAKPGIPHALGGQSVSVFGTQVSQFALPWLVLDLSKSAASIGILNAISFLPYLIFALPAGVIADRWNRKAIMLICDAARGLLVASVPIAYFAGRLTLWQLFAVGALLRLFTIFFDVGYMACLPNLVAKPLLAGRERQTGGDPQRGGALRSAARGHTRRRALRRRYDGVRCILVCRFLHLARS